VKIFVIHSGADYKAVEEQMENIRGGSTDVEFLMLENGGKFWHIQAEKKIRRAQLVFCYVGENSHKSENIAWEIKTALRFRKSIIVIRLKPGVKLPEALYSTSSFSGDKFCSFEEKTADDVKMQIENFHQGDYGLFNKNESEGNIDILLQQYKIFLETSESLVARRQTVNNFYISVNAALISIYSAIFAVGQKQEVSLVIGVLFSIIGIVLCLFWREILQSYGRLNASKMKVINFLESRLPASLYDTEWKVQSDKLNNRPYVSFTTSESRIPFLFIVVYSLIICFALGSLIINR